MDFQQIGNYWHDSPVFWWFSPSDAHSHVYCLRFFGLVNGHFRMYGIICRFSKKRFFIATGFLYRFLFQLVFYTGFLFQLVFYTGVYTIYKPLFVHETEWRFLLA